MCKTTQPQTPQITVAPTIRENMPLTHAVPLLSSLPLLPLLSSGCTNVIMVAELTWINNSAHTDDDDDNQ